MGRDAPETADEPRRPIAGLCVDRLPMAAARCIQLIDYTDRPPRRNQGGSPATVQPAAQRRLGLETAHWTGQVKGIGTADWRIVGHAEAISEKA